MSYTFNQTTTELQEAADAGQALYEGIGIPESDGAGNITFRSVDNTPTSGSNNLITSDAVNDALEDLDNDYQALVPTATEDDIAIFNAAGQVKDSSKKLSDYLATAGGTMSGAINMGSNKITSLADGTNDTDAINKGQLDNALIDSMITDTASGAIASFPDGSGLPVKSLIGYINPVQDLHGYDHPWPAGGGGKNLLPLTVANAKQYTTEGTWVGNVYHAGNVTYTLSVDDGGNIESIIVNGTETSDTRLRLYIGDGTPFANNILNGLSASGCDIVVQNANTPPYPIYADQTSSDDVTVGDCSGVNVSIYIKTNANTPVSNIIVKPMIRLSTEADPTFAPYSNICPISGFTGMNVVRIADNLATGQVVQGSVNEHGVTGYSLTRVCVEGFIECVAGKKYSVSVDWKNNSKTINVALIFFDTNNTSTNSVVLNTGWQSGNYTVICPNGAQYFRILIRYSDDANIAPSDINYARAGQGEVYAISWQTEAGTVYEGELNVTTGELTVEKGFYVCDGNTSIPDPTDIGSVIRFTKPWYSVETGVINDCACNQLPKIINFSLDDPHFYIYNRVIYIYLPKTVVSEATEAAVQAYLAVHPLQFIAPLATPQTYQLTPTEVKTLLGQNNIWVDTNGNVDVEYRADTKLYIDKKLGA